MTRYLIDSHVLIWWWSDPDRLPPEVLALLVGASGDIFVSAASGWEIATKFRAGKLPEVAGHINVFDAAITDDSFRHLDVRHDHAVRAGLLEGPHRDPFDRLIAAQALVEGLTVVTRDPQFAPFGCDTIW